MILVDDGSTDASSRMCDDFAVKHENIKVVHKTNGGLSDARNVGIGMATGEYIVFLDSDDFWNDENFLSNCGSMLDLYGTDMLLFGYEELYEINGKSATVVLPQKCDKRIQTFSDVLYNGVYTSSSCTKIVKRKVISDNNLLFKVGDTSEDIEWSANLIKCCNTYSVYCKSPYVYRQRFGSITKSNSVEKFNCLVRHMQYLIELDICDEKKDAYYNYVAYQYITVLHNISSLKNKVSGDVYNVVKNMTYLLKYRINKKVKTVYWVNKIFGFDFMLRLLRGYIRVFDNKAKCSKKRELV